MPAEEPSPSSLASTLPPAAVSPASPRTLPPSTPRPPLPTGWAWWFGVPLVVALVTDLATKAAIFRDGRQEGDELAWWCELAWNRGMAWGIGNSVPHLVLILTLILIPVLTALWWRLYRRDGRATNFAFGLILGGAFGNAYDRVMTALATDPTGFQGVRDFIRIDLRMVGIAYTWPNFNVADAAISIGFVLLLLLPWITRPRASAPPDLT